MLFKATIYVTLKKSILDPQGSAVTNSLNSLGYKGVRDVRIGKYMTMEMEAADKAAAEKEINEICDKMLANPNIENYRFELVEG